MCLVVIGTRIAADLPLVIGANREEFYGRGGTIPQLVSNSCRFIAGLDPVAGGTWLGVNEHGLVVAVANRPKSAAPQLPRSRGLLVRDLLGCAELASAGDIAGRELSSKGYAGCNLLCADASGAVVFQAGDDPRMRHLEPGWHAFTARDVDDQTDVRIAYSLRFLQEENPEGVRSAVDRLKQLCADTRDTVICLHGQDRGTVSSSIIAVGEPRTNGEYWHCQGSPDRNSYVDYSELMRAFSPWSVRRE